MTGKAAKKEVGNSGQEGQKSAEKPEEKPKKRSILSRAWEAFDESW